jgi:hypothetical protein
MQYGIFWFTRIDKRALTEPGLTQGRVRFAAGSTCITDVLNNIDNVPALAAVAEVMRLYPAVTVNVTGTRGAGEPADCELNNLPRARAEACMSWLVRPGIQQPSSFYVACILCNSLRDGTLHGNTFELWAISHTRHCLSKRALY